MSAGGKSIGRVSGVGKISKILSPEKMEKLERKKAREAKAEKNLASPRKTKVKKLTAEEEKEMGVAKITPQRRTKDQRKSNGTDNNEELNFG
jgi:hypothetical protein